MHTEKKIDKHASLASQGLLLGWAVVGEALWASPPWCRSRRNVPNGLLALDSKGTIEITSDLTAVSTEMRASSSVCYFMHVYTFT